MSQVVPSMRQRILDAAFTVFMRFGYGGASTLQIARLAQVSKRDLYALFGSKQAMLAGCVIERAARMRHQLTLPAPSSREALSATLIAFGAATLLELSKPEVLATYRLAILEAENAPDIALTLDRYGRAENAQAIDGLMAEAAERGLLHGGEATDMAAVFMGVLMGGGFMVRLLMRVIAPPTEAEARHRAEAAADRLFRAYGGSG
jgi:AcrR family transcriptional regulator